MENSGKKLSVEPYKGTRDFYPEDEFVQNYIFGIWKKVVESYGYLEYDASILEETELYKAKSGEEIVNEQTYSFTDRGGRDVTIRPEMTPTVARMVAQKRKELSFPLRWYSIPNLFRYERPQRGRLREHWQLNVDMFGVDSVAADIEQICIAYDVMKAFGASDEQFEIRLNHRKLTNHLLRAHLGLDETQSHAVSKLIDRMNKMPKEEFLQKAEEVIGDKAKHLIEVLFLKSLDKMGEVAKESEGLKGLAAIMVALQERGIKNFVFDPSLMRGFDYYTGTVFEVFDLNTNNPRSIFGGGRYDDLVGIFGVEKVSGVGFGVGDVTTRDFLETYGLLPQYEPSIDLYIAPFDENFTSFANKLAVDLRKEGLRVAVDLTDRQVTKKVKTADKEQIPWILVVGEQEQKSGKFKLKNLKESKEQEVSAGEIARAIKHGKQ